MSTIRRAAFTTIVLYISKAVGIALSTVTLAITVQYLGVERFGDYSAAISFAAIVISITDLGLTWIVSRELAQGEREGINALATFKILFSALCIVAAIIVVPFIGMPPLVERGIYIAGLYMFFVAVNNIQIAYLQGSSHLDKTAYGDICGRIVNLILVWWIVRLDYGYGAIVASLAITSAVVLLCNQYYIRQLGLPVFRFTLKGLGRYQKEIIQMTTYSILGYLIYKVDMVLLARLRPSFEVGIYAVAYRILDVAMSVPSILVGAMYPILSQAAVTDDAQIRGRTYRQAALITSIIALMVAVSGFVFAPLAIQVVAGKDFSQAGTIEFRDHLVTTTTVFRTLSVFLLFAFLGNFLSALLISHKKQQVIIIANIVGFVVNFTGNLLFIPRYSYLACALLTLSTQIIILIPLTWGVWRLKRGTI